jgi:hypothetical protein
MTTVDTGGKGLIQFDNVAVQHGPGQTAEVRNLYQWTMQFGPTAEVTGGAVGNLIGSAAANLVNGIGFYIKSTDLPRITVETQTLNQYNIRRNVNTHVSYEPLTMTFYDTQDNAFQQYLMAYMAFKSKNWDNAPNVRAPFQLGSGYVPEFGMRSPKTGFGQGGIIDGINFGDFSPTSTLNDNFASHIVITKEMMGPGTPGRSAVAPTTTQMPNVDVMGNVTGYIDTITSPGVAATPDGQPEDKSQQITLYNPKIVDISQDQLDYANGGSALTWTITWRYESYAYGPPATTGVTAVGGATGTVSRGVQEVGRSVGRFFENVIRRFPG